jgi:hypothetical protein
MEKKKPAGFGRNDGLFFAVFYFVCCEVEVDFDCEVCGGLRWGFGDFDVGTGRSACAT